VYDRRINFDVIPADATMYAVARLWLQNDPSMDPTPYDENRVAYDSAGKNSIEEVPKPLPVATLQPSILKKQPGASSTNSLNDQAYPSAPPPATVDADFAASSSEELSHAQLLQLHVQRLKRVRQWWLLQSATKYRRFKTRLAMRGIPPCRSLDNLIARHPDGESDAKRNARLQRKRTKVALPVSRQSDLHVLGGDLTMTAVERCAHLNRTSKPTGEIDDASVVRGGAQRQHFQNTSSATRTNQDSPISLVAEETTCLSANQRHSSQQGSSSSPSSSSKSGLDILASQIC